MADYKTDGSSALASNDPYNDMERSDIRPNLQVIEGGGKGDGISRGNLRVAASNNLNNAENSASAKPVSTIAGGADSAKDAEQAQPFANKVAGLSPKGKNEEKTKGFGFFRKKGPLVAMITLLLGGGGLIAGSQALMPFATANRLIQEFNSMKTSMDRRANRFLKFQLDSERYKSPTRTTLFGNTQFKLSQKQVAKLAAEGIFEVEIPRPGGGKPIRALAFDDGSGGPPKIITANAGDTNALDGQKLKISVNGAEVDIDFSTNKATNVVSALDSLDGFRNGYLKSSKTWKGNIAGWFDTLVLKVFDRLGISRNRFAKWKNASDIEAGNAEFKRVAASKGVTDNTTDATGREAVKDDQGTTDTSDDTTVERDKPITGDVVDEETGNRVNVDDNAIRPGDSEATIGTKLRSKGMAAASAAGAGANVVCALMAAAGTINAMVVAHQTSQILNYVTGFLESVQKVQAGDGDASPMIYYTNALTTPGENNKTGTGSAGFATLFSNNTTTANYANDASAQNFNLETSINTIAKHMSYSMQDFMNCSYAKMAAGIVDSVVDVLVFIFGGFGIGNIVKGFIKSAVISTAVAAGVSAVLSIVIPELAKMLVKDLVTDIAGEDVGNAIVSGGNIYMGKNHQGGGGSPADQATVLAYRHHTEAVLAEEAEYERQTLSPFDISSQNTFLGSLMHQLIPYSTSVTTSASSVLTSIGGLLSTATTNMLPSASAVADTRFIQSQGNCPTLESMAIMADMYCNPYYVSDSTTFENDPGEGVFETVAQQEVEYNYVKRSGGPLNSAEGESCVIERDIYGNPIKWGYHWHNNFQYEEKNDDDPKNCVLDVKLDIEDNPIINAHSEFGKYILFCNSRESTYGIADAGITSAIQWINTGSGTLDTVIGAVTGSIPVLGGVGDSLAAANEQANAKWIGGGACVARQNGGSTNSDGDHIPDDDWRVHKNYQRYSEDQRLLESSGMIKKSAVTAVLEEYYEQNPLDQSYEGILARKTGLSKEEIIATLDLIDYASFIAEYDPSNLAPMLSEHSEVSLSDQVPNLTIAYHETTPVYHFIIYTDVRNRSYAV